MIDRLFKAMDHAFQHVIYFVRNNEWFVCTGDVLHYGSFQAVAANH